MKNLKNYYHILGVDKSTPPEEIKKAYRKLAVRFHPDHNPDDRAAEEKFKEISEAYAVLTHPRKRVEYDQAFSAWQAGDRGGARPGAQPGARGMGPEFSFTQEDFQDVFARVFAGQGLRDLAKEFQRHGLRFDESFFQNLFSGRRGFFFGGVFFSNGPTGEQVQRDVGPDYRTTFSDQVRKARSAEESTPVPEVSKPVGGAGWLARFGRKAREMARQVLSLPGAAPAKVLGDITFELPVTLSQAMYGDNLELAYQRNGQAHKVAVKLPPGTRNGARLRLRGMGNTSPDGASGDLFLQVRIG